MQQAYHKTKADIVNMTNPVHNPGTPQGSNQNVSHYGLMQPNQYGAPQPVQQPYVVHQQPHMQPGYAAPQQQYHLAPAGPLIPHQYMMNMNRSRTITGVVLGIGSTLLFILFALSAFIGGSVSFVLALVPLSVVIGSTFWIGRWDPEPAFMRILAFLWGAIGSIVFTFAVVGVWEFVVPSVEFVGLAIQAPVVEELAKGLFVLFLALFFKKYMNSPIDGVVFVMLAAGGFAFTENILYFVQSTMTGGAASLGATFVLRGVMSPFAHALFSLPMGILLGWGVRKNKNAGGLIGLFLIGYALAALLHALWNGSSYLIADMGLWFVFYLVVQMPLFVGAIFIIRWLRNQEAVRTYKYLNEYAWYGWFTAEEVATFGTWKGRKYILRWAKTRSPQVVFMVKTMNKEIVDLANARDDIVSGVQVQQNMQKENFLLHKINHDRSLLARS